MPFLNSVSGTLGVIGTRKNNRPNIFRYFVFDPIAVKTAGNFIQLSEFNLMNGGTVITSATYGNWNNSFSPAASIGDANSPGNETPALAKDQNTGTKWLDFRGVDGGFYIDLGGITTTTGYQMYTANDGPDRDPTTWKVYGSTNNSDWYLISDISGYNGTNNRFSLYGQWNWVF